MRKPRVVRDEELAWEPGIEPPLQNKKGIGLKTVDNPKLQMHRTYIPPGGRNQRHYHVKSDAGMFVLKGNLKIFFGPDYEIEEILAKEGDFVFAPAGVIHGLMNISNTEPAELITTKNNVSSPKEGETVFVEPSWVK